MTSFLTRGEKLVKGGMDQKKKAKLFKVWLSYYFNSIKLFQQK